MYFFKYCKYLDDFSCFKGRSLELVRFFITQKEDTSTCEWTKKTLEPNFRWREQRLICRRWGCPNSPCWKFHPLEPSPQSLWFGWDPNMIGHAAVCDFCAPKKLGGCYFPRGRFRFIWWWVFWFFGVFYREAHCFGKAIPLPHSQWVDQPLDHWINEVGLCAAAGVSCGRAGCWKPMAGSLGVGSFESHPIHALCVAMIKGWLIRGNGHPTLNRTILIMAEILHQPLGR